MLQSLKGKITFRKKRKRKDRASSSTSNICQQNLKRLRKAKFTRKCPLKSPDCNPLDFWVALKVEFYKGRSKPFPDLDQLKENQWSVAAGH